jgi:osmotically-inducible protein OsmY
MRNYDWDFGFGFGTRHRADLPRPRRESSRGYERRIFGSRYDRGFGGEGDEGGYRRPREYPGPSMRERHEGRAGQARYVPEHPRGRPPERGASPVHARSGAPFTMRGGRTDGQSDATLRQAVRESLHRDRFVDADALDVEVSDGVVTLRGEVDDFLTARYAWDDAWETEGVHGVVNLITVRTDRAD